MKKTLALALLVLIGGCGAAEAKGKPTMNKNEAKLVLAQLQAYAALQTAPVELRLDPIEILEDSRNRRYFPSQVSGEVLVGGKARPIVANVYAVTHRKAEPLSRVVNRWEVLAVYREAVARQNNVSVAIGWVPYRVGALTAHIVGNQYMVGAGLGLEFRRNWNVVVGRGPSFETRRYQNFIGIGCQF